jgi:hypothetical protein
MARLSKIGPFKPVLLVRRKKTMNDRYPCGEHQSAGARPNDRRALARSLASLARSME